MGIGAILAHLTYLIKGDTVVLEIEETIFLDSNPSKVDKLFHDFGVIGVKAREFDCVKVGPVLLSLRRRRRNPVGDEGLAFSGRRLVSSGHCV